MCVIKETDMKCNKRYQDAGCSYCSKYWNCDILSGRDITQETMVEDLNRAVEMAKKAAEVAEQIKGGK